MTFDEPSIELGILSSPAWFEDAGAWAPLRPLAREPLGLQPGWEHHYLPALSLSPPSGFAHALRARLEATSRAGSPDGDGILVAQTSLPAGHLALGPFDSLLRLLVSVDGREFAETTPSDYCTSLCVNGDEDLSWLREAPSARDHEQVRGILARLAGMVALLDRGRAWALRVGDHHPEWQPPSALAGLKHPDAFRRREGLTCADCGGPFDSSIESHCPACMLELLRPAPA